MVNPIRNRGLPFAKMPTKKKPAKEMDVRVGRAAKRSKPSTMPKASRAIKASSKVAAEKAYLAAEKVSVTARQRAFEAQRAAVKAQKALFLAQRAHMAQQAAAMRRARAAAAAKRAAEKAARHAAKWRSAASFKASLAKPDEKKRDKLLKKYLPTSSKKKKPS